MMKPVINSTIFGSINIKGDKYKYDTLIRLDGRVRKRKKKLSKQIYGTSHILSLEEAMHVYEDGAAGLIFGTGHFGKAALSDEAAEFFKQKDCQVEMYPTPQAIIAWNEAQGDLIGLFHITC
jgi:hypothetical protein